MTPPRCTRNPAPNGRGAKPRTRSIARCTFGAALSLLMASGGIAASSASLAAGAATAATATVGGHAGTPAVARRRKVRVRTHVVAARAVTENVAPVPNFLSSCTSSPISIACVTEEVAAINNARQSEGIAPMVVNLAGLAALSGPEQVLALTDLERVARGRAPVVALTAQLNTAAAKGAVSSQDPSLVGWKLVGGKEVTAWASNWAGGLDVLGADYLWMYDDGVGYNVDCPTATAAGCWGHRDNVLIPGPTASSCTGSGGQPELVMGAAVQPAGYHGAVGIGELFVTSCGGLPSDTTFTWSDAKRALAV